MVSPSSKSRPSKLRENCPTLSPMPSVATDPRTMPPITPTSAPIRNTPRPPPLTTRLLPLLDDEQRLCILPEFVQTVEPSLLW